MLSTKERAAQIMEHLCSCYSHGYSQYSRLGDGGRETIALSDGSTVEIVTGDRDCSSAVIDAYRSAGADVGGATYTGNMRSCMCGTGQFEWHSMSSGYIAQRGDIYLNEVNHTAMCTSAVPDMLAEFSISETGSIDGAEGDQTGWESHVQGYYDYPWDGILVYVGPDSGGSQPAPAPQPQDATVPAGTYTCVADVLNVRDRPSTGGAVVASYSYGQTVVLDEWSTVADGYVWGRYTAYSGATRYIAVRTASGEEYLSRSGQSASPAPSPSRTVSAGAYRVVADSLNVRESPSTSAAVVASYSYGQTVNLDGWSTVADGYVWGRYIAYSGATRYIAVGVDGGEDYLVRA
ncbi:MAG: SH3 domain-containing protein [Eggerthellaceae bacterium]